MIRNAEYDLTIYAGPCSIDPQLNLGQIKHDIAGMEVKTRSGETVRPIAGTRDVGTKSRTAFGNGMGLDAPLLTEYFSLLENNSIEAAQQFVREVDFPSALIAEEIVRDTGLFVATEVMMPEVQLPSFDKSRRPILEGNMMIWNPAVMQLGWPIKQMAAFARRNGWDVGLKNPKDIDTPLSVARDSHQTKKTSLQTVWEGTTTYVGHIAGSIVLIHRGVNVAEKEDYRNALVHEVVRRTKLSLQQQFPTRDILVAFDPSHALGPKRRDHILKETIHAMHMKTGEDKHLYDVLLVEAGDATTDTDQHITISELHDLTQELSQFRRIQPAQEPSEVQGIVTSRRQITRV